jgi:hypothetical protein
VASKTHWNSRASPIATTSDRPAFSAASRYGRITSSFRSPLRKITHGMSLPSAYRRTAARNPWLILPSAAGDAIGNPRQPSHPATCPDVCRAGTQPLR